MDELLNSILKDLPSILAGLPLEFEKIPDDDRDTAVRMAVHCCLNGPVGVNKLTRFPTLSGERKIRDVCNVSNKSWKGFCAVIATQIKRIVHDPINCSATMLNGNYWPLADWRPVSK
jgi:hypothetical protein